jgi:hypothetical protein
MVAEMELPGCEPHDFHGKKFLTVSRIYIIVSASVDLTDS